MLTPTTLTPTTLTPTVPPSAHCSGPPVACTHAQRWASIPPCNAVGTSLKWEAVVATASESQSRHGRGQQEISLEWGRKSWETAVPKPSNPATYRKTFGKTDEYEAPWISCILSYERRTVLSTKAGDSSICFSDTQVIVRILFSNLNDNRKISWWILEYI